MNEIKCPNCGVEINLDDSTYLNIVKQVHNKEFDDQVKLLKENNKGKLQTELESVKSKYEEKIGQLEDDIELRDKTIDKLHNLLEEGGNI